MDTPPSTPGELQARSYGPTSRGIRWARSTDDCGVCGYEVSRDEQVVGVFDALSLVERSLDPGRGYTYAVVAIDTAGTRSGRATVLLTTPDALPPTPVDLRAAVYSSTSAGLAWSRGRAFGERYEVRRDGQVVATTSGRSHIDRGLTNRRGYLFEVIAVNRKGQRSRAARIVVNTGGGVRHRRRWQGRQRRRG